MGHSHTIADRNLYRVEYLLDLLSTSREALNFQHDPSFSLVWKGTLAYRRELLRFRQQLRQSWQTVVTQLLQKDLLTADEATALTPNIAFKAHDHRENQTEKLPEP